MLNSEKDAQILTGMKPPPVNRDGDADMAKAFAERLKIPFLDPLHTIIDPSAVSLLKSETAFKRQALPIRVIDDKLLVAMAAPDRPVNIRSLEILTGFKIRPAAAPEKSLSAALRKYYGKTPLSDRTLSRAAAESGVSSAVNPEKGARNISIISNKGGVGKTHLSINLACSLAKTGAKVLLIDADLGNADISNKLGLFPKYHLMDFLEKKKDMRELVCPTPFGFHLIGGSYGEFKLANLNYAQKTKFIKHFRTVSLDYEFVIFDLGAGISRTVLDFALAADHTLIVTTPQDLISGYACTKAAYARFKEIEERLVERVEDYVPRLKFSPLVVVNQVYDMQQGIELFHNIKKTADKNINSLEGQYQIEPEYIGAIPYDKESMRLAEGKRKPLMLALPRTKASQSLQHMSKRFCEPKEPYDTTVKFMNPLKRFAAILSQKM